MEGATWNCVRNLLVVVLEPVTISYSMSWMSFSPRSRPFSWYCFECFWRRCLKFSACTYHLRSRLNWTHLWNFDFHIWLFKRIKLLVWVSILLRYVLGIRTKCFVSDLVLAFELVSKEIARHFENVISFKTIRIKLFAHFANFQLKRLESIN